MHSFYVCTLLLYAQLHACTLLLPVRICDCITNVMLDFKMELNRLSVNLLKIMHGETTMRTKQGDLPKSGCHKGLLLKLQIENGLHLAHVLCLGILCLSGNLCHPLYPLLVYLEPIV